MATQVKIGGFIYRINPDDDREMQHREKEEINKSNTLT